MAPSQILPSKMADDLPSQPTLAEWIAPWCTDSVEWAPGQPSRLLCGSYQVRVAARSTSCNGAAEQGNLAVNLERGLPSWPTRRTLRAPAFAWAACTA